MTLAVTEMARSVAFYERLGFALRHGGRDADFTSFAVGSHYLNLTHRDAPVPGGWGRVIFYVSDVDAMYEHARAVGASPQFEPRDAPWGERYFHLLDPDGHELSFARPLTAD